MPIPQVTDRIKEAPAVVLRAVFAGIGQLLMAVDKIRAQTQEQHTSPALAGQNGTGPAQPSPQPANGTSNVTQLRGHSAPAAPRPAAAQADTAPAVAPVDTAPARPAAATRPAVQKPAATRRATTPKSTATVKPVATPKPTVTPKPAARPKPTAPAQPTDTAQPADTAPPTDTAKPAAGLKPTAAKPTAAKPTAAKAAAAQPASAATPAAPIPGYDDLSVASLRARLRGLDADGVQALLAYEKTHARRDDVVTMFERRLTKIEDEAR
jgi:hypothetical protein